MFICWCHEYTSEQNKVHVLELVSVVGHGSGPQITRDGAQYDGKAQPGLPLPGLNSLASKETSGTKLSPWEGTAGESFCLRGCACVCGTAGRPE